MVIISVFQTDDAGSIPVARSTIKLFTNLIGENEFPSRSRQRDVGSTRCIF